MMRSRWAGALLLCWFAAASATMPGPTLILQCPESDQRIVQLTWASGNTFGARRWSDGYVYYPRLPSSPRITRCDEQGKFFWVAEVSVVRRIEGRDHEATLAALRQHGPALFLSRQGYLDALAAGMARNRDEEIYLRARAWWAANDHARGLKRDQAAGAAEPKMALASPFVPRSPDRDNLERLVELLATDNPSERLMKAEGLRQLGRFEDAWQVLQARFPAEEMEAAANLIRKWVEKGHVLVEEVSLPRNFGRR